jgi:peptide/nickel transport system substrate-binding protein
MPPFFRAAEAASTEGDPAKTRAVAPWGRYITQRLNVLGYKASFHHVSQQQYYAKVIDAHWQIGLASWTADYPTADDYFSFLFSCNGTFNFGDYCNHRLDREIADAAHFQVSDPAAADARWAQIDHQVTDQAIWAPLITAAFHTTTFVGPRVGNYTNLAFFGTVLSQLWVR